MIRRLFTAASVLSLLLSVTVAWLWARSYHRVDEAVAGYWAYRPHPRYPTYLDGWEFNGWNDQGRLTFRIFLRGCVGGPGKPPDRYPRDRSGPLTLDYRF